MPANRKHRKSHKTFEDPTSGVSSQYAISNTKIKERVRFKIGPKWEAQAVKTKREDPKEDDEEAMKRGHEELRAVIDASKKKAKHLGIDHDNVNEMDDLSAKADQCMREDKAGSMQEMEKAKAGEPGMVAGYHQLKKEVNEMEIDQEVMELGNEGKNSDATHGDTKTAIQIANQTKFLPIVEIERPDNPRRPAYVDIRYVYEGYVAWWCNLMGKGQVIEMTSGEARTIYYGDIAPCYGALVAGVMVEFELFNGMFLNFWVVRGMPYVLYSEAYSDLLKYPYMRYEIARHEARRRMRNWNQRQAEQRDGTGSLRRETWKNFQAYS